jgi:hypothetical protein
MPTDRQRSPSRATSWRSRWQLGGIDSGRHEAARPAGSRLAVVGDSQDDVPDLVLRLDVPRRLDHLVGPDGPGRAVDEDPLARPETRPSQAPEALRPPSQTAAASSKLAPAGMCAIRAHSAPEMRMVLVRWTPTGGMRTLDG